MQKINKTTDCRIVLLYQSVQPDSSLCFPRGRKKLSSPSSLRLFFLLLLLFSSPHLLRPRRSRSSQCCSRWWSRPGSRVVDVLESDCILAWQSAAGRERRYRHSHAECVNITAWWRDTRKQIPRWKRYDKTHFYAYFSSLYTSCLYPNTKACEMIQFGNEVHLTKV